MLLPNAPACLENPPDDRKTQHRKATNGQQAKPDWHIGQSEE
jgi:hypothetical protein